MNARASRRLTGGAVLLAILALPLAGAALGGRPLGRFFQFPPPLEIPAAYPRFSWLWAALVVVPFAVLAIAWLRAARHLPVRRADENAPKPLPWWGVLSCGWTCAWWIMAWTRFPWFAAGQRFTFFPLWLGFGVGINALSWRRTGSCLLVRAPGRWVGLFAASALFWWVFEWLNRFVGNWHYLGVEEFGPFGYAAHATLCFSTVLPAVAAVSEWLHAQPHWAERCAAGPALPVLTRPMTGLAFAAAGSVALVLTGFEPQVLYPAVWLAPLLLIAGTGIASRQSGVWNELARGDWRRAASWALAALLCGFFWELWNYHSLAKWIYTVPYADRWHFFEMPLLGYSGYLPFGLECLVACDWIGAKM
jgi:hypothetical protein